MASFAAFYNPIYGGAYREGLVGLHGEGAGGGVVVRAGDADRDGPARHSEGEEPMNAETEPVQLFGGAHV
ncbi:hypothetical protein GCM10007981_10590 [Thermocladium modestius]|uniref:Uncharacterized protein n=1 Tax=Thermocladium modestius TaxID=62609 RepID=A0A830GW52_9CREN|nr:hypothetical protein GCM10007981_10590 [Thermocladium modestius]